MGTRGAASSHYFLPLPVRYWSDVPDGLHLAEGQVGGLDHHLMQNQVPTSYHEAKEMFSDLGKALRLQLRSSCITTTRSFLTSIMNSLFDDMHWVLDNQAACLLFSCEEVVKMYLRNLARRKGGIVELSHMLVAMIAVCGRLS